MKLLKIMAIAASAMFASAQSYAGTAVLSNLGSNGNSLTGVTTSSTEQTASVRNAAGFQIGANSFTLETVNAVFEAVSVGSAVGVTFGIYADNGSKPGSGSPLVVSTSTNVDTLGVYSFNFAGGYTLTAATKYWAVVETGAGAKWFGMGIANGNPSAQNGSGLSFVAYDQTATFDSSKTWLGGTEVNRYGFALIGTENGGAVPEPALTSLLCLGGVALIRRRMKK